jgi:hypothetical protein
MAISNPPWVRELRRRNDAAGKYRHDLAAVMMWAIGQQGAQQNVCPCCGHSVHSFYQSAIGYEQLGSIGGSMVVTFGSIGL